MSNDQSSHRINVNAAEQDDCIESVTVFQSNRAEVKRRVDVDPKKGQNHISIERLPSCIEEDSIRVDGTGTAIIFDVVYHKPEPASEKVQETTAVAQRQVDALRKEREISQEQAEFLSAYGRSLDSKNLSADAVQQFLDMFGPRQIATAKRIQELDVQITKAEEELSKLQSESYADAQGQKRATKITVTVLAETEGPAELVLRYDESSDCPRGTVIVPRYPAVSDAGWTPLYDVRATIANSPNEPSTVALHYRASITQSTGENWPEVALTLSTASPQLKTNVPTLSSWRIGFPSMSLVRRSVAKKSSEPIFYPTQEPLVTEIAATTKENKRQCPKCRKWFNPKPSNWLRHMETHTDRKRFECTYQECGERKRTKDQVIAHFVTHHIGMKLRKGIREQRIVAEQHVYEHD